MSQVVLITGCSSGIGRAVAQRLTASGYTVVATARRVESLDSVAATTRLPLDVTESGDVEAVVAATLQRHGHIDVLVNNAGYAVRGAIEEVPDAAVRQLFDVNVFGVLRMVRAVAPVLRQQGAGRIITISSIAGKMSTPGNGHYSASKFAIEGLSDALRLELGPFGVFVSLVEPGPIETQFDLTSQQHSEAILANPASPYRALYATTERASTSMRRRRTGPDTVARVVQRAIEARSPKARYLAGVGLSAAIVLHTRDYLWGPVSTKMFAHSPQAPDVPETPSPQRHATDL
jgi:NAD(P)-dependent dehydrogenase (short-subunit alcohol dehydrogenase family)